ncbi:MAG: PAS domain-containing protein [Alphaproteobacteria bacterium]|jgi:two-component system cell cycle sensor histidine kinase PleC|nr:PAS domain-containing protein [Alphaproteobacteria bacterium]
MALPVQDAPVAVAALRPANRSRRADLNDTDTTRFVEISPNNLVVLSPEGHILRANANFSCNFASPEGGDFTALFHVQDRPRIAALLRRMAASLQQGDMDPDVHYACEGRMVSLDGLARWMRWEVFPGQGVSYAIGRDMTAIKAHEQALLRKQAELCEAESIARMGRWHWKIGHAEMRWSPEIYAILGQDPLSFTPSLETLCAIVDPENADRLLQVFQRALIERASYEVDMRLGNEGDGSLRVVRCEGRCELDVDGDVVALYGIMQDITARVLYERDLCEAKEEAERASAAKTQFLANMSHELRTPLNAIIGFSEIMQSQLLGPLCAERYGEYINSIHASGQHLLSLISDILDMSKIHAGKYTLTAENVNLGKLVRLAAHMMEGSAQEADVRLILEGEAQNEESASTALADRRAVMQVVLNLLSNAIKFTPAGGCVSVSCAVVAGRPEIVVRDTGIGIPPDYLQHITLPFEQVQGSYARQHEGSGLGLAITKDLVELHGGSLLIDSTPGVGTCVTVWLPAAPPQESVTHNT